MNFVEYFKSLFGSGKKYPEIEGLNEFINELKKDYTQSSVEEVPTYQRKDPVVKTDEEIREEAENSLKDYYYGNKDNIESEYEANVRKKQGSKEKFEYQLQNELDSIADSYSEAKQKSDNASLKQGIARSSIAEKKTEQLDKERKIAEDKIGGEYALKLKEIDLQLAELEEKKNQALNDLNIAYATKLADKINKLTEERQKTLDDALEYNNKLDKQEYEERLKAKQQKSFYPNDDFYRQVYIKADELLSQMDRSDARDAVNNNELLKEYLNDYYYYKLYEKYSK